MNLTEKTQLTPRNESYFKKLSLLEITRRHMFDSFSKYCLGLFKLLSVQCRRMVMTSAESVKNYYGDVSRTTMLEIDSKIRLKLFLKWRILTDVRWTEIGRSDVWNHIRKLESNYI